MSQHSLETFGATSPPDGTTEPSTSKSSDERGTPRRVIRALHKANGGLFHADLAAGAEPERIGYLRFTKEDDALSKTWDLSEHDESVDVDRPVVWGSAFLNPPFSLNTEFAEKVDVELSDGHLDYLIFLLSAQSLSANWFHDYIIKHAQYLCVPEDRYGYTNSGDKPGFPSVLVALGDVPPGIVAFFEREGRALDVVEETFAAADLQQFVEDSAHSGAGQPQSIQTADPDDEPVLNDVRRGSKLVLEVQDAPRGFPESPLHGETVPLTVQTWQEAGDSYEVLTTLAHEESPFEQERYTLATVEMESREGVSVALHRPNRNDWQPLPVASLRTVTADDI